MRTITYFDVSRFRDWLLPYWLFWVCVEMHMICNISPACNHNIISNLNVVTRANMDAELN